MFDFINSWQLNLVGYLFFVTIFTQYYRLAVKNAKNDGAATIVLQVIAGLSVMLLAPFFEFKLPKGSTVYVLLFLAIIFYAINDRLQTTARKHLPVSLFSIVSQFSYIFLIIYGFIIFKDPFVITKVAGAALVLGGNFLIFYKKGKLKVNKYMAIAILAALSFSTAVSIDIGLFRQFNPAFYIMITLILPAFLILLAEKIKYSDILKEFYTGNRKYFYITGIAWAIAIMFSLRSFQYGEVTKIVPLQATAVLINVVVAYFFLKEKKDEVKKIIASLLILAGVYLTVI